MEAVRQYKFYELGARLNRVAGCRGASHAAELFVPLMEAQAALDTLLKGDPVAIELARPEGTALLGSLGNLFNKYFIDATTRQFRFPGREETIDVHELTLLRNLIEKFETALAAELSRHATYAVPKRGLFERSELAERADQQFSPEVRERLGAKACEDVRQAGRALAFGMPLAASFHLVRAVNAAFGPYLKAYTGAGPEGYVDIWKEGLGKLTMMSREKGGPDTRIVAMLADIDARYRQNLRGASAEMSDSDAQLFFSLASSLLTLMMEDAGRKANPQAATERLAELQDGMRDDAEPPAPGGKDADSRYRPLKK